MNSVRTVYNNQPKKAKQFTSSAKSQINLEPLMCVGEKCFKVYPPGDDTIIKNGKKCICHRCLLENCQKSGISRPRVEKLRSFTQIAEMIKNNFVRAKSFSTVNHIQLGNLSNFHRKITGEKLPF